MPPRYQVKDVSVIIVNYNGETVLTNAIESVLSLPDRPKEVIVVDNGSTDASPAIIEQYLTHPLVRVIISHENLGVAGGRNLAVSQALGRLLAFLDADAKALPSWLPEAVKLFNARRDAGAVAPLVLMSHGDTINGAGSFLDASGHGRDRYWGEPLARHEKEFVNRQGETVDYPMGCGMIIRRDGLERLWPLDETLLKWHDDTEIGIRIRRLGMNTLFCPQSRVLHRPGHSDPANFLARHAQAEQARLLLLMKYYPFRIWLGALASLIVHGVWAARRRPSALSEVKDVIRFTGRHWRNAREIRRQWTFSRLP